MDQSQSQTIVLLMAAGFSRRFKAELNTHKLLYPIDNKLPLLNVTFRLFEQLWGKNSIVIVTNKDEHDVVKLAQSLTNQTVIIEGDSLGSSISGAVGTLQDQYFFSQSTKGIIIALADMPFIVPSTLKRLQREIHLNPNKIIRPVFQNRPGHPVYFPLDLLTDLQNLYQQDGAKPIIQNHLHRVMNIEVDDSNIRQDIDRLSDLPHHNEYKSE